MNIVLNCLHFYGELTEKLNLETMNFDAPAGDNVFSCDSLLLNVEVHRYRLVK